MSEDVKIPDGYTEEDFIDMNNPNGHPDRIKVREEKICPHVGEPCIGQRCSEFVPRHNFIGGYNWGIQDEFKRLWCWFKHIEYKEKTYVGTCCAHCNIGIWSAHRWDKEEFKDTVVRNRL